MADGPGYTFLCIACTAFTCRYDGPNGGFIEGTYYLKTR